MLDELRWTLRSLVIDALLIPEYRRSGVAFNPLSDRVVRNPYPAYARLRARSPVHRSRVLDGWVFSRYADVEAIFRDYRRFSNMPTNRRVSRRDVYFIPPSGRLVPVVPGSRRSIRACGDWSIRPLLREPSTPSSRISEGSWSNCLTRSPTRPAST